LDEVKQKVLLDLFASPGTLAPLVIGLSSLMYAWAIGGDSIAGAVGIIGVLGGIGHFASRLVFGLDGMTQRAYEAYLQKDRQARQTALDDLERNLKFDNDRRDETVLHQLRQMIDAFTANCQKQRLDVKHHLLILQVEEIFDASVEQLKRAWELAQLSETLAGGAKKQILNQREQILLDVIETRDHLEETIQQFYSFAGGKSTTELKSLRHELDESLQVAKRTHERMSQMDQGIKTNLPSEFNR